MGIGMSYPSCNSSSERGFACRRTPCRLNIDREETQVVRALLPRLSTGTNQTRGEKPSATLPFAKGLLAQRGSKRERIREGCLAGLLQKGETERRGRYKPKGSLLVASDPAPNTTIPRHGVSMGSTRNGMLSLTNGERDGTRAARSVSPSDRARERERERDAEGGGCDRARTRERGATGS